MIYNRLSNAELGRWLAVTPDDKAAQQELMERSRFLIDRESDDLKELECQMDAMEANHRSEINNLQWDLDAADVKITANEAFVKEFAGVCRQIASLVNPLIAQENKI